ncbi:MAG: hypothetical protein GXO43_08855, partial [Crenarchaeota archaeon]|nr:hypothetical protein [Thermoproteota archaeon]
MYTLPKVLNLFHMVFIALSFNQLFLVAEAAETDFTCSNPHAFETRFNTFVTGGLVAIGNSNVCADDGATNGAQGNGICDENQSKRNDLNNIIWINKYSVNPAMPWYNDIHNAPDDLLNVSNATLELPEGAKVIWAGLYWHGEVWNFKEGVITNNSGGDYGSEGLALMAQENRVKLRTPIDNVSTYRDIVADEHYWINLKKHNAYSTKGASYGYGYGEDYNYSVEHSYAFKTIDRYEHHYQGFTDVTSLLQEVEAQQGTANGTYWLGNIQASVGFLWWSGVEAAWSLQVAYSLDGGKPRVITMSDGYVGMFNYAGWGIDYAQEQNCSTNAEDTGSYTNSISFEIDNIYTPKKQPFNTDMTIFVTESDPDGDQYDPNLPEALSITKKDGTVYQVDGPEKGNTDAWAYEISDKDGNPIQREPNHWQYPIGMTIKNYHMTDGLDTEQTSTTVTFSTDTDRLIMGVVGFVTDVRMPDLCYDYGYAQDNRYFTEENNGTALPHIKGNLYSNNPINVNLFIKNREESDVIITGMKLNIDSIDTTQASYILGSAKAIKPGESLKQEADVEEEADSYIKGAKIGTIGSQEFFYFYYDLSPELFTIDMPIVGSLDFNTSMTLPDGQVFESPYHLEISNAIPMCVDGNFSYAPLYGTFNIEQKGLEYYNIYTQIANRADNFEIKAYSDPDDDNSWDTPTNVSTAVAIEVIDASAYHETQTSCQEPDSALTPRVWILFDENVSSVNFTAEDIQNAIDNHMVAPDTLSSPEAFYSIARQNAAFRISLGRKESNGTLYQIENNQGLYRVSNIDYAADLGNGAGECAGDVSMSISGACPANMNKEQLTYCMECLYASKTAFICSRDNFAIRPEAFIVSISDDNTSTVITDFANNINQTGDSNTPINLVAGYPYRFDINATSHTSSNAVQGYTQKFTSENPLKVASMIWDPRSISITEASTFCNVPQDRNMTFSLIKGTNINPNPINTWEDRHDALLDIGEYRFDISDEEWTKYDWDTSLIQHHLKTHFNQDNLEDCIRHDVTVTTVPNSDSITEQSGCLISSNYTPNYTDIYIRSYPYSFDLTGLTYGARPQNIQGNTYVYINSLDATPYTGSVVESNGDENMSYNIQGEIKAVGFTNQPMKNFVDQC